MNTKLMIIGGILIAVSGLVLAGSGLYVWHSQRHKTVAQANPKTLAASTNESSQTQPQSPNSTTGLSSNKQNSASVPANIGYSNQASQPSPSSLLDPSTFSQYDKYKDGTSALFIDLQKGDGDELTVGKKAAVLYKGWLTNGQLFDASRPNDKGQLQPFVYTLGEHQVIAGWEQAMAGMKVGGVRLLIIPPSVGYGANGQPPIPGNAVLVFQVQLVSVQ